MPHDTAKEGRLPLDDIVCGDCVEVMRSFPEGSVDLVFADPPYNLQLRNTLYRPNLTKVDAVDDAWDSFESFADYDRFTEAWLEACRRVLGDSGTIWVIGSYHNIHRVGRIMMDLGYWLLNDITWVKTNPMPNFRGARFTNATETLIWAKKSKGQKTYTFNHHAMKALNDDKQMRSVWEIPLCTGGERISVDGRKAHSTQKPEALLYRVIAASSAPGDVVLDPFLGSGTTAAVARKLGRRFVGIDSSPDYVEVARRRVETIQPAPFDEALLSTPSRRTAPRVPFGDLVAAGLVAVGETLHSQNRKFSATVKADSHLTADGHEGSIHKLGARLLGASACNGWDFWHAERDGRLVPLDELRRLYRARLLETP